MDILKKIFPLSWKFSKDVKDLIIGILIYLAGSTILGFILGITIIGIALAPLVGIYSMAGIVIQILVFAKVIKDEPAADAEATEATEEANDESAED